MRSIIVGDVHGCLEELDELLKVVQFTPEDTLIFVGDLIDRGPDPVGVVRRARELNARSVLGNHEEKCLRWLKHAANERIYGKKNPMRHPGEERLKEWEALNENDVEYMRAMVPFLRLHQWVPGYNYLIIHAGLEPGLPVEKQKTDRVIRVRYINDKGCMVPYEDGSLEQPPNTVYWDEQWKGPETVIYGHAVHSLEKPRIKPYANGIDTGCVFGGRLTCYTVDPHDARDPTHFIQVAAKREYHPPLAC